MHVDRTFLKAIVTLLFLAVVTIACATKNPMPTQNLPPVDEEFRYHLERAGEVTLVWGVNGWGKVPAELIPSGTEIKNDVLHTLMVEENGVFVAQVRVPAWSKIDYGFLITRLEDGSEITPVWDGGEEYILQTTEQDGMVEIDGSVELPESPAAAEIDAETLIEQEFLYKMEDAGEVTLVWGVDGWMTLPESLRPPRTTIVNNVMHTPMTKEKGYFRTTVQVPAGKTVDYGFLITKRMDGMAIEPVWDGEEGYRLSAESLGQPVETISTLNLASAKPVIEISTKKLLPVEINYQAPEAGEVVLVWGINGWRMLPEESRPAGTWVENKVMKTLMTKIDDDFRATVNVPEGSSLDYGFLITKSKDGSEENIWDGGAEGNYQADISEPATLQVASAIKLDKQRGLPSTLVVGAYLFAGIVLIALVGFLFRKK